MTVQNAPNLPTAVATTGPTETSLDPSARLRAAQAAVAATGTTEATIAEASLQLEESAERTRSVASEYRRVRTREKLEAIGDRREAAAWKLGGSIARGVGSIGASLIGGDYGKIASAAGDAVGAGLDYGAEMRTQDAATHDLVASGHEEMADGLNGDAQRADGSADKLMNGVDAIARARAQGRMTVVQG